MQAGILAMVAVAMMPSAARAAGEAPELELEPCRIELVDGREVKGHLAVQFDMREHLIVYAPRLATVRSFLKEHVHAVTVEGKRDELNPKRALSEADRELLGRVAWPNEPPAGGLTPPYATETWEKPKQLLVWARPGKSGRFEEPSNWLSNGRPMKAWPRAVGEHYGLIFFEKDSTDFLFPASSKGYMVRPRATSARPRHITAEAGADAEIKLNTCTGNIWISPNAAFDGGGGADLGGVKHTFFFNGTPYTGEGPTTPERFRELMESAESFGRKWVVRKESPEASMTLIGSFGSGDETHWARGVTILEENSVIAVGPRCVQTIGLEATMVMKSGAVLGKRSGNQCYKNDMQIKGALMAGTPDEPITRDVYLGISIKDPKGHLNPERARRSSARGLTLVPGARIEVHTADPAKARLVITWHGILGESGNDDGTPPGFFAKMPEADRTINVNFFGDHVLSDVVFDWVGKGDIRLLNPGVRSKWQRVSSGENNKAAGDAVFAKFEPGEGMKGQLARWRQPTKVMKWARNERKLGARYPRILPSGGTFAAGDTVAVRLDALSNPEMRYTLNGGKSEEGQVYSGPFELTETTTVKAGCFHYPPPLFYKKWEEVADTFTFVEGTREADRPGATLPGLLVRVYENNEFKTLHDPSGKPEVTQTPERFELKVPDGRMQKKDGYVYTGYVEIGRPGIWRFYTRTEGPSRLYIGDQLVVDNHRRYRYDWNPSGSPPLESWGSLRLGPGKHAIRVEYGRGSGFSGWPPWEPQENEPFEVSYEGPGIESGPIPSERLSHKPEGRAAAGGGVEGNYRVAVGKWFVMKNGEFMLAAERPDLPDEELRWRAWAAAHRINKGPYWPYDAVRDHGKVLEHIEATPQQKRTIDEIVRIARKGGEVFEHETKPRYRQLGDLEQRAKQAGHKAKADKYRKMKHVQVSSKLALQRAPFFEILTLLTDEQWESLIEADPKYRKLRQGMADMKQALADAREKAN
jgi:hypothetical protein